MDIIKAVLEDHQTPYTNHNPMVFTIDKNYELILWEKFIEIDCKHPKITLINIPRPSCKSDSYLEDLTLLIIRLNKVPLKVSRKVLSLDKKDRNRIHKTLKEYNFLNNYYKLNYITFSHKEETYSIVEDLFIEDNWEGLDLILTFLKNYT